MIPPKCEHKSNTFILFCVSHVEGGTGSLQSPSSRGESRKVWTSLKNEIPKFQCWAALHVQEVQILVEVTPLIC